MERKTVERSYNVVTYGRTAPKAQLLSQIDQYNILSAARITNQLASTVVTLVFSNGETCSDSPNKFLLKILSLEPFSAIAKNMRKDKLTKVDASDSALATLKGIRALTELCSDDSVCQSKIADFGAFSLLRRFILQGDYERIEVIEANDTSRTVRSGTWIEYDWGSFSCRYERLI